MGSLSYRTDLAKLGGLPLMYALYPRHLCMSCHVLLTRFERDTAKWRVNRKLVVQQFPSITSTRTRTEHVPIIEAESCQLLYDLLRYPDDFMEHPMRFASSVMTSIGLYFPAGDNVLTSKDSRRDQGVGTEEPHSPVAGGMV